MPDLLLTLWGPHNEEILTYYSYGKEPKRRRRITPVKLRWHQTMLERIREVARICRGK